MPVRFYAQGQWSRVEQNPRVSPREYANIVGMVTFVLALTSTLFAFLRNGQSIRRRAVNQHHVDSWLITVTFCENFKTSRRSLFTCEMVSATR